MISTTRRGFLQLLGLGATATAAGLVVPEIFLPEEKKVRTYFDMGRNPKRGEGIWPIDGYPGMFWDASTGRVFNIRDFAESEKYDTIIVPASHALCRDFASFGKV